MGTMGYQDRITEVTIFLIFDYQKTPTLLSHCNRCLCLYVHRCFKCWISGKWKYHRQTINNSRISSQRQNHAGRSHRNSTEIKMSSSSRELSMQKIFHWRHKKWLDMSCCWARCWSRHRLTRKYKSETTRFYHTCWIIGDYDKGFTLPAAKTSKSTTNGLKYLEPLRRCETSRIYPMASRLAGFRYRLQNF